MVKVSVVVPVYNVKMYLDECVNSLLGQTLNDIDIILVDDGSTDGSQIMCDKYAEQYDSVRVIHKKNGGLGSARNVGLDAAIGKYVYFIDSDDSIKKESLEELYRLAEKDSLDVILFSAECFSDEEGINYNPDEYRKTQALDEVLLGKDLFIRLVDAGEYYASIPMRFYRTEYLQKKEYRFPEDIIHEDEIVAYWSLIQAKSALSISDRFYNRRFRSGSIMTSKRAYDSSKGYIYTWKQMMLSLGELSDWNESEKDMSIRYANSLLGIVAGLYANELDRVERQQIRNSIDEIKKVVKDLSIDMNEYKWFNLFVEAPNFYRIKVKVRGIKGCIKEKQVKLLV